MAASATRCAAPSATLLGPGYEVQGAGELVIDIGVTDRSCCRAGDDQDIARRQHGGVAEEFAHQAADTVAYRGTTDLAASGDAESRRRMLSLAGDHDEVGKGLTPSLAL